MKIARNNRPWEDIFEDFDLTESQRPYTIHVFLPVKQRCFSWRQGKYMLFHKNGAYKTAVYIDEMLTITLAGRGLSIGNSNC